MHDGSFLVVDDEYRTALQRIDVPENSDDSELIFQETALALGDGLIQRQLIGRLDDLEGAARGLNDRLYIIGSHNDAYKGKLSSRQKLVSFSIGAQGTENVLTKNSVAKSLRNRYPALAEKYRSSRQDRDNALNIEALAFDRKRDRLLIGLRSPRIDSSAIVVSLLNPTEFMQPDAQPDWAESIWTLDLDKGGLRAMAYDDRSDSFIVVSQRETGKKKRFKCWVIAADGSSAPRRVKSKKKKLFANVEGVVSTPEGILFVRDDGKRKKKQGASWFLLHREQLGLNNS